MGRVEEGRRATDKGKRMKEPQPSRSWRELLEQILQNPQERQRIASQLGVNPVTLTRWVSGQSVPRGPNLRRLLEVLSQHRTGLLALLEQDIPGITASLSNDSLSSQSSGIPFEFYERILHTRASLPHSLRFSSLCDAILQQALKQLDPDRLGLAIIVARCMPPSSSHRHLIRTLRESAGRGTPPWESSLEAQATFLGAESLAGHAVTVGHLVVLPNLREEYNVVPGYRDRWEESAAATPIMLAEEIAGCLLVSSTQPNYFQPAYQHLVQCYAELLALAFEAQDFYEPQRIQLGFVPPAEVQRKYLSQFRQRVAETMRQAARKQQGLSLLQAEHLVWQQIEAELLQDNLLASNTSDSTRPKGPLAHVEET